MLIKVGMMLCLCLLTGLCAIAEEWRIQEGPLMTRWAKEVSPDQVHPEYPRPQMVRDEWMNLNGLWQFAPAKANEKPPLGTTLDERILVPFPVESALSGIMRHHERVWYRCTFNVDPWIEAGHRVLLHFGAVDWESLVWINGTMVTMHRGGYSGFTVDITQALVPAGEQELVVGVWDPTDQGDQPRGKQVLEPGGIWYTPTTGIWQTVWLEPVPAEGHITGLHIVPDLDQAQVRITVGGKTPSLRIRGAVIKEGQSPGFIDGEGPLLTLPVANPRPWSPDDPFLHDLVVELCDGERVIDRVTSYFGLRKVSLEKDENGINRLFLNNKPLFMVGPLDQGFWPDGLYTAPTDEALRYDIEVTRRLGFNMARKHVKVEPARWYYWADRLGLMVWQDMPNGNNGEKGLIQFQRELEEMINTFRNHPSIVLWVVFNEGWGQFDTVRFTQWLMAYDPTRLVNNASGWTDKGVGHVLDIHAYPGPASPQPEAHRAAVLGEFGGLGLPVKGHTWQEEKNWGYRTMKDAAELTNRYETLLAETRRLKAWPGLTAAVYTQTTDVEIEVNGIMTYDRAMIKVDEEAVRKANLGLHHPLKIRPVVPTSVEEGLAWHFTFEAPAADWFTPAFDDKNWPVGPGGFGTEGTPGAVVRTEWKSGTLWIRRSMELPEQALQNPHLIMHHDEDAEVFINGVPAASCSGYTTGYVFFEISEEAKKTLKPGPNLIAIHCKQTKGGQYIDSGMVDILEASESE